ncbi:MAG: glycosyltransferase [Sphingomonadaceae bacterium]|nr:glycosyltransferase [Sphingomonadaceae bacterium]
MDDSAQFSATTEEVVNWLHLAQVSSPKTCLWIGQNASFAARLSPLLGPSCATLVLSNSAGDLQQGLENGQFVAGPAVAADALPDLAAVIDHAVTQPDPNLAIAAHSKVCAALRGELRQPALDRISEDLQISRFDLAIIAGEQILADVITQKVIGSRAILVDGTRTTFGGSAAFARLFSNPDYLLAAFNDLESGGWALFVQRETTKSNLPIHFFTIVLNGEPFIRYHEQMLLELDFPWHWHVVEGVASLVKDTAWSVAAGGHIPDSVHAHGKSNDGTTEYLDELKARFPNKITIYRKPDHVFWDGKQEMVSAPIPNIQESCLLWQVDADELWTAEQVRTVRQKFIDHPEKSAAYFWCNYYVGSEKGVSTRYNYAQNPRQEWLRVWRFEPGMKWDKHEPPVLAGFDADGNSYDVGQQSPFMHREMELCGAVFDHFAYTTPEQARFKEAYYGYANAVEQWQALQQVSSGSGHLRDYFAWVSDETMFDDVSRLGWAPVAYIDPQSGKWRFRSAAELEALKAQLGQRQKPRIVVDGVFYQLSSSGIARVWTSLLQEWIRAGYADNIVLIDRAGTAPRIDGLIYHSIELHNWDTVDGDARLLQEVCDLENADLFLSTYYTTPVRTPSVFFGHDMIPEIMGFDLDDLWWRQKRRAIQYAAGHIMVSQSSANDMCRFHPEVDPARVLVAHNSVAQVFTPCTQDEIDRFRQDHGIERDFIMMVGERFGWHGYKNGGVVFAALAQMDPKDRPLLVCVGGQSELEETACAFLDPEDVKLLKLDDAGLRACYGSALAYVCPSRLEGFGLPVAEAMAVGCPALVCRNSSIPEVAGEAGVYFDPSDASDLVAAIQKVRSKPFRDEFVAAGLAQAASFSQERSAKLIAEYCESVVRDLNEGKIRQTSQALEDAYNDAEARRSAEQKAQALQQTMDELKRRLASSVRIPAVRVQDVPAFAPPPMETRIDDSLLIAMERRLANAYAQLRSYERATSEGIAAAQPTPILEVLGAAQAAVDAQPSADRFAPLLKVHGLNGIEGPYPEFGISKAFRWQVEPASSFVFQFQESGPVVFELDFSNVEPDQKLRVLLDGEKIGEVVPPEYGWDHVWHISLPASVDEGERHFVVEATASGTIDSDHNPRYIAIHGISVRLGD